MITIVSKENTWHDQELLKVGKQKGIGIEMINLFDLEESQLSKIGKVILWRSSSLGTGTKKAATLKILRKKGKVFVNNGIVDSPQIVFKSFQQEVVKSFCQECQKKEVFPIPTFLFRSKKELQKAIAEGKLSYPFIMKPDLGAKGKGVKVISDSKEFNLLAEKELLGFIFQNFIENKGDYRVFVIGGKPVGIMKRIAQKGSFLNNISQGGRAIEEKDKLTKEKLSLIASKIASLFDLGLCGVDFIFNEKDRKYYFLEINTVPQWQGFQKATKINVASLIVDYCNDILNRKNCSQYLLIKKNYQEAIIFPDDKKFHFYSRMFLWTKNKKYQKELEELKNYFIGSNEKEKQKEKIKFLQSDLQEKLTQKVVNNKKSRKILVEKKFFELGSFHEILFRNLLAKNIFGVNLKKIILNQIPLQRFLDLAERILKKKENILTLSTFAVNYLYFLVFFSNNNLFKNKIKKVIGEIIEEIKERKNKKYNNKDDLKNEFYLLTHCIIGESQFYFKKIEEEREVCQEILEILEDILVNNYFDLSLDNKLEFLVCCRLVGHKTFLKKIIEQEAANSFSSVGNFIIDKWNTNSTRLKGKDFFSSEHRNLLYILSQTKPKLN